MRGLRGAHGGPDCDFKAPKMPFGAMAMTQRGSVGLLLGYSSPSWLAPIWFGRPPSGAPATKTRACPLVKPVREPDAGDPQVRFDERRWETELRPSLRHRHQGESRRQQLLPRPTATPPAADSTLPG